ncbi:hypothetical protein RJ640_002562 [Escallonia rubra]|uniref:Uncharacterized protein n=1 Tax=Escallonia rubra TaxID=112253 RepID=A0AA88UVU7_9ASTE|nr:hypothetical protein RJ640_002562 [Escallonia rubra]
MKARQDGAAGRSGLGLDEKAETPWHFPGQNDRGSVGWFRCRCRAGDMLPVICCRIPKEIGWLENLVEFSGRGNRFTGSLPASIVNLGQLGKLDLQSNRLSGELPSGVHTWKKLNELNLADNELSGNIPEDIGSLSVLNYLDLSGNRFSGKIPVGSFNVC